MNKAVVSLVFTLCALALVVASAAGDEQSLDLTKLDALIAQTVQEKQLVGLSAGVMHEGRVVLARGYGLRSLATNEPVTPETLFAVGSVTKQLTCAAVLLLAEEGKLSLGDPVAKYAPELTQAADVTLLDLGQHVAGYPDYYPLDFVHREMARPKSAGEIIREYGRRPLDFEPGTRWSYSNTGYLMLGSIAEQASGEAFGRLLERRILEPLGLRHTRYEPRHDEADLAKGYSAFALGDPEAAPPEGEGWAGAAGAVWSTPTDLLAWNLALMDGKLLSPDSYRVMTTPGRLADGRSTGYGCGQSVRDDGPALVLTHGGAVNGFNAMNTLVPIHRSAIVLLTNRSDVYGALRRLQEAILEKLLPDEKEVPIVSGPPPLDAAWSLLGQLRGGKLDRTRLGEEFAAFLTSEKVKAAAASLGKLGEPKSVELGRAWERGGMEGTLVRFKLGEADLEAVMYRSPDGKIQQFLIYRP